LGLPVVLVADDESVIVDTLAAILTREGFHVLRGYGGPQALSLANGIRPDLLISDVFMPELNGPELAMAVLELAPACKLLFVSGHAGSAEFVSLNAAGHTSVLLHKPVPPRELIRQAITLLGPLAPSRRPAAPLPFPLFSLADAV
jgi:CheY-like chemotaxis protein